MSAPLLPSSSWQPNIMLQGGGAVENLEKGTFSAWCGRNLCCANRSTSEIPGGLPLLAPEAGRPDNLVDFSTWNASVKEDKGTLLKNRRCIYLATSALAKNVQGAVQFVYEEAVKSGMTARFVELPYNDLDSYEFKNKINGPLILCHSIHNRRCSITDVTDSLYDKFLTKAKKNLGRYNVAVIMHDFPDKDINNNSDHKEKMLSHLTKQPSMFKCANLVFMTAKLANYDSLPGNFKHSVGQFIDKMRERSF